MYLYLYSLAFIDHPCTLCAAVCHQAPPCPLYIQHRARQYELGVLMDRKLNCLDPSGIRTHDPYSCTNVVISMVPQCYRRHIICLARPIWVSNGRKLRTYALSEDSDQPAHLRRLVRIFTKRIFDIQGCKVSSCGQWRPIRLRACAGRFESPWYTSEGTLSHVAVNI